MVSLDFLIHGAGRMGGAILEGLLDNSQNEVRLSIIDPSANLMDISGDGQSVTVFTTAEDLPDGYFPDAVVVALKPQIVSQALRHLSRHLK